MAKRRRFVISVSLVQRDELEREMPKTLHITGVYRTRIEGQARMQYDCLIALLKEEGFSYDSDPISEEVKRG